MNSLHIYTSVDLDKMLKYFIWKGKGFVIESTGKSVKITDIGKIESYIISEERIGFKLRNMIKRTKDNVHKNIKGKILVDCIPQFYQTNKSLFTKYNGSIENVIEIDLSKAYLEAALRKEYISQKIYDEIFKVAGKTRKRILGSLATKKRIETFDSYGVKTGKEIKIDKELRICWNNICMDVDQIMFEIIRLNAKERFCFYWIDNIFFLNDKEHFPYPVIIPDFVKHTTYEHSMLTFERIKDNLIRIELSDSREFLLRI